MSKRMMTPHELDEVRRKASELPPELVLSARLTEMRVDHHRTGPETFVIVEAVTIPDGQTSAFVHYLLFPKHMADTLGLTVPNKEGIQNG